MKALPPIARDLTYSCRLVDCPRDPLRLLENSAENARFFWQSPDSGLTVIATGIAAEIRACGSGRFQRASREALSLLSSLQPANGGALAKPLLLAGFGFSDSAGPDPAWNAFPPARLCLPRRQWLIRNGSCQLIDIVGGGAGPLERDSAADASGDPRGVSSLEPSVEDQPCWQERAAEALSLIAGGKLAKVVLAHSIFLTLPHTDPTRIIERMRRQRKKCFHYMFAFASGVFLGSTPELLVSLGGGRMKSSVLAGTIGRGRDAIEDDELGKELLLCSKNGREHALVLRDVLRGFEVLGDGTVFDDGPSLLRLPEAQHLQTIVSAKAKAGFTVVEAAGRFHPTPAVCGTPPQTALELIERHEDRGWYSGVVGWMDATGGGELAVALRSALLGPSGARLWAGAGIVEGSSPAGEFLESKTKMAAMARLLTDGESSCAA